MSGQSNEDRVSGIQREQRAVEGERREIHAALRRIRREQTELELRRGEQFRRLDEANERVAQLEAELLRATGRNPAAPELTFGSDGFPPPPPAPPSPAPVNNNTHPRYGGLRPAATQGPRGSGRRQTSARRARLPAPDPDSDYATSEEGRAAGEPRERPAKRPRAADLPPIVEAPTETEESETEGERGGEGEGEGEGGEAGAGAGEEGQ